jgi:hypothetical protein
VKDSKTVCGECAAVITGQIQFHECAPALKRITEIGKRIRTRAQRYTTFAESGVGEHGNQMATWSRGEAARLGAILGEIADAIEGKS